MATQRKPFRTIKDSYRTGRFSREEIRAAWLAVMAKRGEAPASGPEAAGDGAARMGPAPGRKRPAA